jgi:hypothetical protein
MRACPRSGKFGYTKVLLPACSQCLNDGSFEAHVMADRERVGRDASPTAVGEASVAPSGHICRFSPGSAARAGNES